MPRIDDNITAFLFFCKFIICSVEAVEIGVESVTERNYPEGHCVIYDIMVDGKLYVVTIDVANGYYIVTSCGGDKAIADKIESLIGT